MKRLKSCSVDGCDRPHYGIGMCDAHYRRHREGREMSMPIRVGRGTPRDPYRIEPMPCSLTSDDYQAIKNLPTATLLTAQWRMDKAAFERAQWEQERDAEYDRQVRLWRGEQMAAD